MNNVRDKLWLEDGWKETDGIYYKGYSLECRLEDTIKAITMGYKPNGKWCVIKGDKIYHPLLR